MSDSVCVIAAHPDDEVLGCGGTMAVMADQGRPVHVLFLADGETSRSTDPAIIHASGAVRARNTAAETACGILGGRSVVALSLPDNRLDSLDLLTVIRHIETFLERHRPSTVLTHFAGDVNVDHRIVHEAVLAACRPQPASPVRELLFFEVPSSTEWRTTGSAEPFHPNWFVDVSSATDRKMEALQAYASELRPFPHPRSVQAVTALMQWRGATAGVEAAEAFVLGRRVIR